MPHKDEPLDGLLDAALGDILTGGWSDPLVGDQTPAPDDAQPVVAETPLPKYPPLPVREDQAPRQAVKKTTPPAGTVTERLEAQPHGGALKRSETSEGDEPGDTSMFSLGVLSDLASGRATPADITARTGVSEDDLHDQLATALHGMDPKEIAKAIGIQAAEQQLKSGALYGAVLADLTSDLIGGRLKPDIKIELAKLLAKNGRIEPKDDKTVGAGGGFTLNINMGASVQPITIVAD